MVPGAGPESEVPVAIPPLWPVVPEPDTGKRTAPPSSSNVTEHRPGKGYGAAPVTVPFGGAPVTMPFGGAPVNAPSGGAPVTTPFGGVPVTEPADAAVSVAPASSLERETAPIVVPLDVADTGAGNNVVPPQSGPYATRL